MEDATGPVGERFDDREGRLVRHDEGGAEPGGHCRLGREPGDDGDLGVGMESAQDGDARQTERAGAVDDDPAAGRRRESKDGVKRDGERVGEDGRVVGDGVGHGEDHRVVDGHPFGPRAGGVGDHADVDTGPEVATGEAPAEREVAGDAARARGVDAARPAGEPRVDDDPLPDIDAGRSGPDVDDLGDDFVAGDVRQRRERGHRVVDVAVTEVAEDELGVGAADTGEDRPRDDPPVSQPRLVDVVEPERQPVDQVVDVVDRRKTGLAGWPRDAEEECLHWAGRPPVTSATEASSTSWAAIARMPAKNASTSAVFISTTAFMSGM